ncbi:MAG: FecR domain-containing protein [Burkholderiaceae bacterium]
MANFINLIAGSVWRCLLIGWATIFLLVTLLVGVLLTSPAYAASPADLSAGVIVSSEGDTSLARQGQITTPAGRLQEIFAGDRIFTGSNGQISLRFSDGMKMTIGPGSLLDISAYLKEQGREKSWFDLLRGSLRTVSGLMGQRNPQSFKLSTPTATIGIRGTDFTVNQRDCSDGSCKRPGTSTTEVSVTKGAIDISSPGGKLRVNEGQTARVGQKGTRPRIIQVPVLGNAGTQVIRPRPKPAVQKLKSQRRKAPKPSLFDGAPRRQEPKPIQMPIRPADPTEFIAPRPAQ